ncbi:MAG: glycosyltransferase, partial [Acidobacteriota bacterium]|nr:glycosyltransferase [Acidobacteriota bacterium]
MISIVIPAHDEEALIGATVRALFDGMRPLARPFEIVVVNDASADGTADRAREAGARVVDAAVRQIAGARNA